MIAHFVHSITPSMVVAVDTAAAAAIAWAKCPNPEATVTHGAMDAEHARLLVTFQADMDDRIAEVMEGIAELNRQLKEIRQGTGPRVA
ncbi:hypothetical protein EF910_05440 [Streptomyces sp. WAC07149]|uniref:hypothetical protein n=1 Tax=Streptomyces sp. WAC07149 TaxID=2487425 RepID=UPI000F7BABE7|nr:hypothetical protein [Streptomyces sp. WAC07149]RST07880.1 hypothetical protein EF910_05440 [Streptomyces sp. WAC07149]